MIKYVPLHVVVYSSPEYKDRLSSMNSPAMSSTFNYSGNDITYRYLKMGDNSSIPNRNCILDSGATVHLCGNFKALKPWTLQIRKKIVSSSHTEFIGLTSCKSEFTWLCNFLNQIGVKSSTKKVYCDSDSVIYWSKDSNLAIMSEYPLTNRR